jgi:putative transposase
MPWVPQDSGLAAGRRRTARLMRGNGLGARQQRRFRRTSDSHPAWPAAPDLLGQDAPVEGRRGGSDISTIWTRED